MSDEYTAHTEDDGSDDGLGEGLGDCVDGSSVTGVSSLMLRGSMPLR